MKQLKALFFILLLSVLSGCQTIMLSSNSQLTNSIEKQLIAYLDSHMVNKPRFRQRPLMIVKFEQGQIDSKMDSLTAGIRQRIEAHLLQQQGMQLYRSFQDLSNVHETSQTELCLQRPELFLGIELKASGSEHILSLRMLDKQQGNRWVDGFSFSRNMILNAAELSQLKQIKPDPWLTGFRESPYSSSDIDLLVKDLGQQLKCQLMKQSNIQSLYLDTTGLPETQSFENIAALLQSDLPMLTGLPLKRKKQIHNKNSQLILHLRWVLLNKQQGWGRLALSGSGNIGAWAYISGISQATITAQEAEQNSLNVPVDNNAHSVILLPEQTIYEQRVYNTTPAVILAASQPLIQSIAMEVPNDLSLCSTSNPWRHGMQSYTANAVTLAREACIRLKVQLSATAYVFVVSHSSNKSWNRLFPVSCLSRSQLPESGAVQKYIPAAGDPVQTLQMDGPSGTEEILVFAITNAHQARSFEQFLNQIPDACTGEQYISPAYQHLLQDNFQRIAPDGELHKLQFNRF